MLSFDGLLCDGITASSMDVWNLVVLLVVTVRRVAHDHVFEDNCFLGIHLPRHFAFCDEHLVLVDCLLDECHDEDFDFDWKASLVWFELMRILEFVYDVFQELALLVKEAIRSNDMFFPSWRIV